MAVARALKVDGHAHDGEVLVEVDAFQTYQAGRRSLCEGAREGRGAFVADPVVKEVEALQPRRVGAPASAAGAFVADDVADEVEALQLRRVERVGESWRSGPMRLLLRPRLCSCRVSERVGERRGAFVADAVAGEVDALQLRRVSERVGEAAAPSGPM